jgi:hypothetical protein
MVKARPIAERFWEKVLAVSGGGCWLWLGATTKTGYGHLGVTFHPTKNIYAHRLSWLIHKGPIPKNLFVLHHCDIRNCVNLEHLFLGTALDNSTDMKRKNRHRHGRNHQNAKLTERIVREMHRLSKHGVRNVDIASKFKVAPATVCKILKREQWVHV